MSGYTELQTCGLVCTCNKYFNNNHVKLILHIHWCLLLYETSLTTTKLAILQSLLQCEITFFFAVACLYNPATLVIDFTIFELTLIPTVSFGGRPLYILCVEEKKYLMFRYAVIDRNTVQRFIHYSFTRSPNLVMCEQITKLLSNYVRHVQPYCKMTDSPSCIIKWTRKDK